MMTMMMMTMKIMAMMMMTMKMMAMMTMMIMTMKMMAMMMMTMKMMAMMMMTMMANMKTVVKVPPPDFHWSPCLQPGQNYSFSFGLYLCFYLSVPTAVKGYLYI